MTDRSVLPKIGRYERLEKIGEGGFGIVYRGHDPILDRPVAIKILRSDLATAPDFIERFRREARLAASLRHPHIVNVIEAGEEQDRYYLVMDFLPGGSLKDRLNQKPFTLEETVKILEPLAMALDYAHRRQIIHRDVKPANILFNEEGLPVLTDFGLVKHATESGTTTTGVILGTVEYMAPEQVLGKPASPATDQYSLAIVAYQMLTGTLPFTAQSPFEIQQSHISAPVPDPLKINPHLPPQVRNVLEKAMAKDPGQRFPTNTIFVERLKRFSMKQDWQSVNPRITAGVKAMDRGDFTNAERFFQEALQDGPTLQAVELLEECKRRQQILTEVQQQQHELRQISESVQQKLQAEKWLSKLVSSNENPPERLVREGKIQRLASIILSLASIFSFIYLIDISHSLLFHRSISLLFGIASGPYWPGVFNLPGWIRRSTRLKRVLAKLILFVTQFLFSFAILNNVAYYFNNLALYFSHFEYSLVIISLIIVAFAAMNKIWNFWSLVFTLRQALQRIRRD